MGESGSSSAQNHAQAQNHGQTPGTGPSNQATVNESASATAARTQAESQSATKGNSTSGGPSAKAASAQPGSGVAEAQAQVLQEAQNLLRSLRIAALRVPEEDESDQRDHCLEIQARDEGTEEREENREERASDGEIVVPQVIARRIRAPTGLLDGGATHPLRSALPGEWELAAPVRVSLAVGAQQLRISPLNTILSPDPISPICPLGLMIEKLGCRVSWSRNNCIITHPRIGVLPSTLVDACPVVPEELCLRLIQELEQHRNNELQQALQLRALRIGLRVRM